ncbi:MAG: hypothetical protein G01um101449_141 [Parcubacteria group bacterium Gr01-1014_49]|nr:MAG: hypothetical protein G01um101449_141 [Parcubacteria group bacterium Gr01-1014_49]
MWEKKYFLIILLFVLFVINSLLYQTIFTSKILSVRVLEVGKGGRVVLIRSPHGGTFLINTGPDASILRALGTKLPPWQRSIDTVLLTGATVNAAGGLPDVLKRYRVAGLIRFGSRGSKSMEAALAAAASAEKGLEEITASPDARVMFDKDVSLSVLSPETFILSYENSSLLISSSTPAGDYVSDGNAITHL